jgi:Transposase IS116/IS110/IS902 family
MTAARPDEPAIRLHHRNRTSPHVNGHPPAAAAPLSPAPPSAANLTNVGTARILDTKIRDERRTEIRVEEHLHATEFDRRRSRAAANAKEARMSSRVRSGKSPRICSSVMPPARYSSTSYTAMRVPLIQGLPLRTAGFTVIRSSQPMTEILPRGVISEFHRLRSGPGIGKMLALTILYEIHDIARFDRVQEFACAPTPPGGRPVPRPLAHPRRAAA